jgi:hypothetical protein
MAAIYVDAETSNRDLAEDRSTTMVASLIAVVVMGQTYVRRFPRPGRNQPSHGCPG